MNAAARAIVPLVLTATVALPCVGALFEDDVDVPRAGRARQAAHAALGENGFVVWESNRTGRWRIWRRELDGGGLRQLTPDDPARDHFCPHLSPDGTRLAYLTKPVGLDCYDVGEQHGGVLRLIGTDGRGDRELAPAARSYFEDRAALWLDDERLFYIDGEGHTVELHVDTGTATRRSAEGNDVWGWLPNATETHATAGWPEFPPFDPETGRILRRTRMQGCQPYFSRDGRWGFFIGGGGGPIERYDLRTRERHVLLAQRDPRLPPSRRYFYFPMLSSCQQALGFAASFFAHDHFTSDYEVFVAPVDPLTLELVGEPVRYTFDPGCDRFPDVHVRRGGVTPVDLSGMGPARAAWPVEPDGLAFLLRTVAADNLAGDLATGDLVAYPVDPSGTAHTDRRHALVVDGGAYTATRGAENVLAACRDRGACTLEVFVEPGASPQRGTIAALLGPDGTPLLAIEQRARRLKVRLGETVIDDVGAAEPGPLACVVAADSFAVFVNGTEMLRREDVGDPIAAWPGRGVLRLGDGAWRGAVHHVAVFADARSGARIVRDHEDAAAWVAAVPEVDTRELEARLVTKSAIPTLEQIKPYRDALSLFEYEAGDVRYRVAHRVLLNGDPMPAAQRAVGATFELAIEPYDAHPELAGLLLQDDLAEDFDAELWFALP